jgi:branched-chain amino acid transport system ATP-binding protein
MLAAMAGNPRRFNVWRPFSLEQDAANAGYSALEIVGLESKAEMQARDLAYGELRQLELAMVITPRPKILILDEPLAGMSMGESTRIVELLDTLRSRYAILLVEHDVDAVFALADRVTVLAYGRVLATGLPAEVRANDMVQAAYLGNDE